MVNFMLQEIIVFRHRRLAYWAGNYDEYVQQREAERQRKAQVSELCRPATMCSLVVLCLLVRQAFAAFLLLASERQSVATDMGCALLLLVYSTTLL